MGLTNLPGHNGKVTSDKKKVCNSYQKYKGEDRDLCSYFSVIFEITIKFLIFLVRLILEKVGIDGFTGPPREFRIRYEFGLKVFLKGLECK